VSRARGSTVGAGITSSIHSDELADHIDCLLDDDDARSTMANEMAVRDDLRCRLPRRHLDG
jgi:hypothetical protein